MALDYPPFTPGTPVLPSFLNDVRDHINQLKHPDLELLIPPTMMTGRYQPNAILDSEAKWRANGPGSYIHCPLPLFAGTTVQSITIHGRDTSTAEFAVDVYRRPLTVTIPALEFINNTETKTSGRTNTATSITYDENDPGFPFLTQPLYTYALRIHLDNAPNVHIYGARAVIRRD